MRNAFAQQMCELCERDEPVVLLTGDLGFNVFEEFAERFPERFINVGVAEQNMVGIATGLAEAGFIPFAYSIATFASMRPYEFVRNGALLHRLPIRIVGVGAGFDYGVNGITHYALEDVAVMRAQPEMTVIAPADREQAGAALRAIWDLPAPLYLRLAKGGQQVPGLGGRFRLGESELIREGDDLALVALGSSAVAAVEAAELLADRGLNASVAVTSTLRREADPELADLLSRVPLAITVEAAYRSGGLGSALAELAAERGAACRVVRCGVERMPHGVSGSQGYLEDAFGLSANRLVDTALRELSLVAG
jgi:transketolase